jgi:sirohydrochlorin ferrochelatase
MKAILLIDHGSTRQEANDMLEQMAEIVRRVVGDGVLVRSAHMELADPTIAEGFADCVRAGATEVVAFPYMLSPGKHSVRDIPRLVAAAAREYPDIAYRVTEPFGLDEKLAEVVAARAGVPLARAV